MFFGSFVLGIIEVVMAILFMYFIVGQNGKKIPQLLLFSVIGVGCMFFYSSLFNEHTTVGIDIIIGRLLLAVVWSVIFRERFLNSLFSLMVLGVLEILFAAPIIYFINAISNIEIVSNIPVFVRMMLTVIPFKILEGVSIVYLGKKNIVIEIYEKLLDEKTYRLSGLLFQIFVISVFSTMISSQEFNHIQTAVVSILLMLFSGLVFASALWDARTKRRINILESANVAQQRDIEVIESNILAIKKEKHDFNNQLNAILGLCTGETSDLSGKIKNYIEGVTKTQFNIEQVSNSGSEYVDALLAIKAQTALQHGIKFSSSFNAKLTHLLESEKELIAIFGNIIDNGIEALLASANDDKKIEIITEKAEGEFVVRIVNNGPKISDNLKGRIFDMNFSTKSIAVNERGLGLPIVAEKIGKLGGTIEFESNEMQTVFVLRFSDKNNRKTVENSRLL